MTPPPDDGSRLSTEHLWDEATRPVAPPSDPARVPASHEQAVGRQLIDIHDHLRAELDRLRGLVAEVLDGSMDPGTARSHLNAMTMRQNNWTLGAYCASYCRIVTMHHAIEDQQMFPSLRRFDHRLEPVIDRLEAEHLVIHDVLERLDQALVRLVAEPDGGSALRAAMDLLSDTLRSHLSYEERELVEPLGRLGFV